MMQSSGWKRVMEPKKNQKRLCPNQEYVFVVGGKIHVLTELEEERSDSN